MFRKSLALAFASIMLLVTPAAAQYGGGPGLPIPVPTNKGGTGAALTPVVGDLLVATSPTAFGRIAAPAVGQVLKSNGVGVAPSWSAAPTLTSLVTSGFVQSNSIYANGAGLDRSAASNGLISQAGMPVMWAPSTSLTATPDTGLSRISAGVIGVGTGAAGSVAGGLQAATLNISGTSTTGSIVSGGGVFSIGSASGSAFSAASNQNIGWQAGAVGVGGSNDLIMTRAAAATLQHGAADAASPVAQTIKFQDVVAGTSNTAGVNATIRAPAGTGTGAGGSLIFQVAPAGSAGSNKNAWTNALTIYSSGVTAVSNGLIIGASGVFSWSGKTGLNSGADGSLTVSTNNGTTGAFTITAGASNLATFNGGVATGGPLSVSGVVALTNASGVVEIGTGGAVLTKGPSYFGGAIGTAAIVTGPSAATFQHGYADAASPVAQTIKFQDVVAGTSNTAGVNATIQAPAGTGTGAGGSLIFQVAPAGGAGSAKNAWQTSLVIDSGKNATFGGGITAGSGTVSALALTSTGVVQAGQASPVRFGTNRSQIFSDADTNIRLSDAAGTGFNLLQLGGTTSSFPAIKRNGAGLDFRLADDTNYADIYSKSLTVSSLLSMPAAGSLNWAARGLIDMTGIGVFRFRNNSATQDFTITVGGSNTATFNGPVTTTGSIIASSGNIYAPGSGAYVWTGSSIITAPSNGLVRLTNSAQTDFTRLVLGTADTSGVSFTKSTTTIQAKLGDGSAFTNIQGKLTTDTAYTAGDPTTTGYLVVYDSTGTAYRVPALLN